MRIRDRYNGALLIEAPADKTLTVAIVNTDELTWTHGDLADMHEVDRLITTLTMWLWKGSFDEDVIH